MNEIKSIFDGWEKQFRCDVPQELRGIDVRNGGSCAITYVVRQPWNEVCDSVRRVEEYIRALHPESRTYDRGPLPYANNVLGWTPEQFREIDRQSQIEAIAKPLIDSVPVAEPLGEVDGISYVPCEVTK